MPLKSYAEEVVYTNPKLKSGNDNNAQIVIPADAVTAISSSDQDNIQQPATPAMPAAPSTPASSASQTTVQPLPVVIDKYQHDKTNRQHIYVLPGYVNFQPDYARYGNRVKSTTDCDHNNIVCVTIETYPHDIVINAENRSPAIRTLNINYTLNNLRTLQNSQGQNITLKPAEKRNIDVLEVIDPRYPDNYTYNYDSYLGIIDAIHDDDYVYDLPFEPGQKWMLFQGIGGSFSHTDRLNYYAYDFKLPVGSDILAAREGVVVEVVDGFSEGGLDPTLKGKGNYIYIQHGDGTMAVYSDLNYHGIFVKPGDYVQKDQKIGISGDTGYTSNPIIHFAVLKTVRGGEFVSIPVKMKTSAGIVDQLKAGEYYQK